MTVESLHLVATVFMAGVIVYVQVVHYPLMARVGASGFVDYEAQHTVRTGWVVGPAMVVEAGTALWLVVGAAGGSTSPAALTGLALVAVIWASTFALQVPAHGRLARGFDAAVHRRLVSTNWIRTAAWMARVPVAVALAA